MLALFWDLTTSKYTAALWSLGIVVSGPSALSSCMETAGGSGASSEEVEEAVAERAR
jgi:hypothetical protein